MNDQLETRLEQTLEAKAASLPDLAEDALPVRSLVAPRSHRSWVSGPIAAVLAAAAVLFVVGGSVFLLGRAPSSLGPAAPVGPSRAIDGSVLWYQSEFAPDGWSMGLVAAGGNGVVVIGNDQGGNDDRGWLSTDGTLWTEINAFNGGTHIRNAVGGDFGYLAAGIRLDGTTIPTTTLGTPTMDFPPATVWYSPDGIAWTETALPLPPADERLGDIVSYTVRGVAGTDSFMVATGDEFDESVTFTDETQGEIVIPSRPVAWRSTDGETWEPFAEPGWAEATSSGPVAVSGDLVALVIHHGGADGHSTVWTSENDRDWQSAYRFGDGVFVGQLAGSQQGFIATVNDGTAWYSVDAAAWQPENLPVTNEGWTTITGSDAGFLLAVTESQSASPEYDPSEYDPSEWSTVLYASENGQEWKQISDPDTFGMGFSPRDFASSGEGVVLVGDRYPEGWSFDSVDGIPMEMPESEMWIGVPGG